MTKAPELSELNAIRHGLSASFLQHYHHAGFKLAEPLPVTSREDKSVIFVGAAISALKNDYILPQKIPAGGLALAQNAVRTRNIKNMLADDFNPKWGSYFTNIDTVCPYVKKEEALELALDFFYNKARIAPEDLLLRVNSQDRELFSLVQKSGHPMVEIDAHPEKYYRHTVGIDGIYGENFNFAVCHKLTGEYGDVGNFIIFRDKNNGAPLFLEVGFGDTVIMQPKYGLKHIMDCYPFMPHPALDNNYKFKDCIITSQAIMREGLMPSSRDEQSKILYKYLRGIYYFAERADLKTAELAKILHRSEEMIFGNVRAQPAMMRLFADKGRRMEELNRATLLNLKEKGLTR